MGKYNIIYSDPPWSYNDKANAGKRGACHKYNVMSQHDICDLPIGELAAENCCLFLWTTFPKLNEVFDVIKSWGFNYKTCAFVWVKMNKKKSTPFWGMGRWTRACAEICLLATKGKPKRESASVHSVVMSPIKGHSEKPNEVRERIVKLCGDLPRIELFARQKVPGWDCLGNEIDGKDIKTSIMEIIK